MEYLSQKIVENFKNASELRECFHGNKSIPSLVHHQGDKWKRETSFVHDERLHLCVKEEVAQGIITLSINDFLSKYSAISDLEAEIYQLAWAYREDAPKNRQEEILKDIVISAEDIPDLLKNHFDIFDPVTEAGQYQRRIVEEVSHILECEW